MSIPTGSSTGALGRYTQSMRRKPGKPPHRWPVLAPLLTALVVSCATYFTFGAFIADTGEPGERDGVLVLSSCEPNWTVLGVRSECVGTTTRGGEPVLPSDHEPYREQFSHFSDRDVGKTIPMQHDYAPPFFNNWKPVEPSPTPVLGELVIGPLAIAMLCSWFFAAARLVGRGGATVVRALRR